MSHRLDLAFVLLLTGRFLSLSDTNAPAFRFHPELASMTNRIQAPVVLTNSPLLGMRSLQVSNLFSKAGFYWKTNDLAVVNTGYRTFPRHSDYIWERRFMLVFARDRVTRVEVFDQPGACVIIKESAP
jgi:hypothetical protein